MYQNCVLLIWYLDLKSRMTKTLKTNDKTVTFSKRLHPNDMCQNFVITIWLLNLKALKSYSLFKIKYYWHLEELFELFTSIFQGFFCIFRLSNEWWNYKRLHSCTINFIYEYLVDLFKVIVVSIYFTEVHRQWLEHHSLEVEDDLRGCHLTNLSITTAQCSSYSTNLSVVRFWMRNAAPHFWGFWLWSSSLKTVFVYLKRICISW